jgi:hypothetical protein
VLVLLNLGGQQKRKFIEKQWQCPDRQRQIYCDWNACLLHFLTFYQSEKSFNASVVHKTVF